MKIKAQNRLILIVGCLGILLGLVGYAIPDDSPESPRRIYFDTPGGAVLFTHHVHTQSDQLKCDDHLKLMRLKDIGCGDCHHEMIRANHVKDCESCHEDSGYSPEDMSHTELLDMHPPSCINCHLQKEVELKSCRECHGQTGDYKPVDCERCHEDAGYTAEDMTHEELEEIEGHWCNECHSVRRISDAIHTQCNICHDVIDYSTFVSKEKIADDEATRCSVCHLKSH